MQLLTLVYLALTNNKWTNINTYNFWYFWSVNAEINNDSKTNTAFIIFYLS